MRDHLDAGEQWVAGTGQGAEHPDHRSDELLDEVQRLGDRSAATTFRAPGSPTGAASMEICSCVQWCGSAIATRANASRGVRVPSATLPSMASSSTLVAETTRQPMSGPSARPASRKKAAALKHRDRAVRVIERQVRQVRRRQPRLDRAAVGLHPAHHRNEGSGPDQRHHARHLTSRPWPRYSRTGGGSGAQRELLLASLRLRAAGRPARRA